MRTLEFDVKKQRIIKKRTCDFSGLVAGSIGYLKAKFIFSKDWKQCVAKFASFWVDEEEYAVKLDENNCCMIPPEALMKNKFKVSVIGANPPYQIGTNKTTVKQEVI